MTRQRQGGILILGGCGFIGSALAAKLRAEGFDVTLLDPLPPRDPTFRDRWIPGRMEDVPPTETILRPGMTVVHLAWTSLPEPSNRDPHGDIASNLLPSLRWLEGCVETGVSRVIFLSSGGTVYGIPRTRPIGEEHPTDPICSYGIGKLAVEKYLALFRRLHDLPYIVLRASNVYGPGKDPFGRQGAINVFLGNVVRGEPIRIWGDGGVVRDYIFIDDLLALFLRCIDTRIGDETPVFNAGSGEGHSLRDIVDRIHSVTAADPKVEWTPGRKVDVPVNVLDIGKARERFDWTPGIPLDEGIRRTWDWIRSLPAPGTGVG
ncbi:MAG: NAD-dependent epimerase [Deltaproteobacteria bacterium]|nr:NAD-dependent epimerase [Deltaproteobacteria bacterium]